MPPYTPSVRNGRELIDDPYVIRAGVMKDPIVLVKNARAHHAKSGRREWAVSMNCLPGVGLTSLVRAARLKNDWVRVTRLSYLERAGYLFRQDAGSPTGHGNLILSGEPTEEEADWIAHLFAHGEVRARFKDGRVTNPVSEMRSKVKR